MSDRLIDKLSQMFKAYGQKESVIDGTLDVYLEDLMTLPEDDVCEAIDRLRKTMKFRPSIAEILEAAVVGAWGELADEAWAEVQQQVRRVGYNRPPTFANGRFLPAEVPEFSNPIIGAAAYSVGWETLCTGDDSKGFVRSQFIKAFTAFRERETKAKQAGVIPMDATALPSGVVELKRVAS